MDQVRVHRVLKIGRLRPKQTLLSFALLRAKSLFHSFSSFAAFSLMVVWMMQMMPEICCAIEIHSTGHETSCCPSESDHPEQDHHAPWETPCEETGFCLHQCCGKADVLNFPSISVQKTQSDDTATLSSPIGQAYIFSTSPPEGDNLILKRVVRPPRVRLHSQIKVFLC